MNVIQLPTVKLTNSPAYYNLVQFFDVCKSPESCQFYLDVVEMSYDNGGLNDSELFTLRRIGRQKMKKLFSILSIFFRKVRHYIVVKGKNL